MKPNYQIEHSAFYEYHTIVSVHNLPLNNKVVHLNWIERKTMVNDGLTVGIWKIKQLKNQ